MTRVGAIFNPYTNPPEALRDAAITAERSGVHELWLWEDCFRSSAFAAASAALAVTDSLDVGVGIAPMPLRNVAVTAMEVATVARMFPGRFLPGVGHGVQSWMTQVGARVASPLTLMREQVPALRALLAGEEVTVSGRYVTLDAVRLDWPPTVVPPVFAAGEGPKTLALSGGVADGTVLDSRRTPDEVADSVRVVRDGRTAAGRDGEHEIAAYVIAAFGRDGVRRAYDGVEGEVPPDAGDRVLTGDPEQVAAGVRRYAEAGVDRVVLLAPRDEPDFAEYCARVGEVARSVG